MTAISNLLHIRGRVPGTGLHISACHNLSDLTEPEAVHNVLTACPGLQGRPFRGTGYSSNSLKTDKLSTQFGGQSRVAPAADQIDAGLPQHSEYHFGECLHK